MYEEVFQKRLLALIEEIKRFPEAKRKSLEMLGDEIGKKYDDLQKSLVIFQDTLGQPDRRLEASTHRTRRRRV